MQKMGDKTNPITWPVFPVACPDLHKNQRPTTDHATAEPNLDDIPDINEMAKSL
jgi:hypothetical protein